MVKERRNLWKQLGDVLDCICAAKSGLNPNYVCMYHDASEAHLGSPEVK
jgi:hypothetical protein